MSFKYWIQRSFRPGFSAFTLMLWAITGCTEAQQTSASGSSGDDPARVLAVVNGVELTEGQVVGQAGEDFTVLERQQLEFESKQKETRYDILRRNLDKLIAEELIKAEAQAQGIGKDELLQAEVDNKLAEPSQEEIDRIFEINKSRLRKTKEEVRGQIVEFLQGRAKSSRREEFIESLKAKYKVDDRMEPMRYEIAYEGSPVNGSSDASVTLVEFSDFQCPYCTRMTDSMREVMGQYGDQVQRVFLQFPLNSIHPRAQKAAEASLCAHDQDHFWDMHARLFKSPMSLEQEALISKASEIGLDMEKFEQCLNSGTHAEKVREDLQKGLQVGVSGTPALFVNGRPLRGAATATQISAMIEEELKAKEKE